MAALTIVSGGQSGVDRAALDAALAAGLPCGGWCPLGRAAEDGTIAAQYPLRESDRADPAHRTRLNVRDSDATLIIAHGQLDGGTALTARHARELGRPCLVVDLDRVEDAGPRVARIADWLQTHDARILNVAGPSEKAAPGVHQAARGLLDQVLAVITERRS